MKGLKLIISLATAAVLLATAICAVVIFQEELMGLFGRGKEFCGKLVCSKKKDEYEDFADV